MKQVTQNYKTGELKIEEVPLPLIKKGGVIVRNAFSVISSGTERATIEVSKKSLIGKAREKPEQVKQIIQIAKSQGIKKTYDLVMNKLNTPTSLGYSSSGIVLEVGEDAYEFQVGDEVACAGAGYANHAEVVFVPKNLCAKIPPDVSLKEAAFTTLGSIALQGLRQADVRVGERIAVIGLGLIGLLTVQLLKASGCVVIGIDIDSYAIDNAKNCGADIVINSNSEDVNSIIKFITKNEGVDSVIITASTRSSAPLKLAGETCRKKGTVVIVGNVGMNIPRSIYYAKELNLKLSCSYGPGRYDPKYEIYGVDYPFAYVRWTEKRNMEAFLQLLKEKKVDVEKITTHKFKFRDALTAYDLIRGRKKEKFVGVILEYDVKNEIKPLIIETFKPKKSSKINLALIGAGNFAQSTILPALKKYKNLNIEAILTGESHLSKNIAEKFGIKKCFSNPDMIFKDEAINAVIVATRHNLHAPYVIKSLKNNKHVYVEKPLAMNEMELKEIIHIRNKTKSDVFVGFNRRFSPFIDKCRQFFNQKNVPMFILYRINAGFIPADNWIQSPEEGGGRIIGEVCHFVDLCQFLSNSNYKSIYAQNIGSDKLRDSISIIIKFDNGSLANVNYISTGDKNYQKERMEIFCQNSIAVIDDFKKLTMIRKGKLQSYKSNQDKGHKRQIELWLKSIQEGSPLPVPFKDSANSTVATFMIHESLNKGKVILFNEYSKRFFR